MRKLALFGSIHIEQPDFYKNLRSLLYRKHKLNNKLYKKIQTANVIYYALQRTFLGYKKNSRKTASRIYTRISTSYTKCKRKLDADEKLSLIHI